MKQAITLLILAVAFLSTCQGLYPKDSPSRLLKDLDGIWHFKIDDSLSRNEGFDKEWYLKPLNDTILMPVPASYNDITQDHKIRDFLGWAWYDRNFWVPGSWLDGKTRVVLRFESAYYYTIVWVNGKQVMTHDGGHLPFEADIAEHLEEGQPNRVTVAVNNTLTAKTLPVGSVTYHNGEEYPPNYFTFTGDFDFFNYAGIQRSVKLYTTPKAYISDISVVTELEEDGSASVAYTVMVGGVEGNNEVTYEVKITTDGVTDMYIQSVGLREITVTEDQFLINGKPFYFHGIGKHEDWDIIGKGINDALLMKDLNALLWLNASAFRATTYPFAEEMLDLADKAGIVVIGESTSVGQKSVSNFGNESLAHHLQVMKELINRDKNHPSVVLWSLANEPESSLSVAEEYFQTLVEATHTLDPTRPVSFTCNLDYNNDKVFKHMDLIMLNRYLDWYQNGGHPEVVPYALRYDLEQWRKLYKKPIMISEYGAGTIPGFHKDPPVMWTEEYQVLALSAFWPVFDEYRKSFLIGEMVWSFADFETAQSTSRTDGNHKGLLTRQRQPKLAAHVVRERFSALAEGRDYHPEKVSVK
uniref:Beta-glucuronidase n=1 Tax=Amphimedon queenslandica TaxID=400682 RepID=A0A1X7URE5_AMPQE